MPNVWMDIARALLPEKMSIKNTAKFFAALGLGVFEATNTCYGMKWGTVTNTSSLWRPITAVRSGDTHGHKADVGWAPQLATPMHPEYPSGHCAHTGAAVHAVRLFMGQDSLGDEGLVLKSDYNDHMHDRTVPNRKFKTLTSIEEDVQDSRVFGGVHYRFSCEDARVIGHRAMEAAWKAFYGAEGHSFRVE